MIGINSNSCARSWHVTGVKSNIQTYSYVGGNPLSFTDPSGLICFNFDKFANDIRNNRLDTVIDSYSLTTTNLLLTVANTPFFYPRAGIGTAAGSPTSLLSTLGLDYQFTLPFRIFNTTNGLRALGRLGVATTIFEGFYDLTVEAQAAYNATSSNCNCGGN